MKKQGNAERRLTKDRRITFACPLQDVHIEGDVIAKYKSISKVSTKAKEAGLLVLLNKKELTNAAKKSGLARPCYKQFREIRTLSGLAKSWKGSAYSARPQGLPTSTNRYGAGQETDRTTIEVKGRKAELQLYFKNDKKHYLLEKRCC